MTAELGLREAKKQRTREHIAAVATTLFVTQGFDETTIAQIAREAGVAKMTVTNYFPVKEDLLFDRASELADWPADAVRRRPAGTSPVRAVREEYGRRLDDRWPLLAVAGREFIALVEASPVLRTRQRQILDEQEAALAEVLAAEADPADPQGVLRARVLAARLAGVVRVLYGEACRRVLAGADREAVAVALGPASQAAFDDAERGISPDGR